MNSRKKTILLVEDDADLQLLITKAIQNVSKDFFIQVVEDGAEAICYLKGQEPYADRKRYP